MTSREFTGWKLNRTIHHQTALLQSSNWETSRPFSCQISIVSATPLGCWILILIEITPFLFWGREKHGHPRCFKQRFKKIRFVFFFAKWDRAKRSRTKLAPKKVYFHHFAKSNCSFFQTATECVKRFVPPGPRPLDGRKVAKSVFSDPMDFHRFGFWVLTMAAKKSGLEGSLF